MKKIIAIISTVMLFGVSAMGVSAREMNMYIRNYNVVRDVVDVAGFDMLPIADIAGELGYQYHEYGNSFELTSTYNSFKFTVGSASVYDIYGNWYGLDVVPQIINNKMRIPSKFLQDVLHMSYVWDSVTNTIFVASEDTYNWLINTNEYKEAANNKQTSSVSYERYSGTAFRTFSSAIGISAESVGTSSTGSTIYSYGYIPMDLFYSYIAILQSDGMLYGGSEEVSGMVFVNMWDQSDNMLLLGYDLTNGTLVMSV